MNFVSTPRTNVAEGGTLGDLPMTAHIPSGSFAVLISEPARSNSTTSRNPRVRSCEWNWVAQDQVAPGSLVTAFPTATDSGQLIWHGKDWPCNGHELEACGVVDVVDRETGSSSGRIKARDNSGQSRSSQRCSTQQALLATSSAGDARVPADSLDQGLEVRIGRFPNQCLQTAVAMLAVLKLPLSRRMP